MPRVTIGLPVRNGAAFLPEAAAAVLAQSFADFELLLLDNASDDDTPAICTALAAADARVRVVRHATNVGAVANFNAAVHLARAPFFKWMAHDDWIDPAFLTATVAALEADTRAVVAVPATRLVDAARRPLPYDPHRQAFVDAGGHAYHLPPTPAALAGPDAVARFRAVLLHLTLCVEVFGLMRTDVLRRTPLLQPYFGSDKVLLAELALRGRFACLPDILQERRCHARQSSARTLREREGWVRGQAVRFAFPQGRVLGGYARALRRAATARDGLRGGFVLAEYALQPRKLARLVVPGPDNLFGLGQRRLRLREEA